MANNNLFDLVIGVLFNDYTIILLTVLLLVTTIILFINSSKELAINKVILKTIHIVLLCVVLALTMFIKLWG